MRVDIVLKLGGAAITEKNKLETLNIDVIESL